MNMYECFKTSRLGSGTNMSHYDLYIEHIALGGDIPNRNEQLLLRKIVCQTCTRPRKLPENEVNLKLMSHHVTYIMAIGAHTP